MKKLFLLLAMVGMVAVACTPGGGLDDDNNGNQTEQSGGGNDDAIPTDKIVIKPATITVEAAANNYIVAVSSPCSWRANTEDDWITLETELGIDGKQQLIFAVKDYWETEPREGKIVVANSDEGLSAELIVAQKAFVPSITIALEELNFAAEGGEQEIAITSNFEYKVNSSAGWVRYTRTSNGITVTVPNYVEVKERTAEITISGEKCSISKVIKVTQTAFVPELEISSAASYEYDYKGGEFTVAVTANFAYDVTNTADWVKCTKTENVITVSVPNYVYVGTRSAEVKIHSEKYNIEKTITITQTPAPYPIGALVAKNGVMGVVFYFDDTVTKIVSVKRTSLKWSTENVTTGARDGENGANNMEIIKGISGWEDKYPAFKWCSDYGEGWYLPAYNELQAIYNNLRTINATLEANGYTTLDMYYYYWTSNEIDSSSAFKLGFALSGSNDNSKSKAYRVCAVLAF